MFCPNCGKKINDYDNFCKFCGRDLREESYIENDNENVIPFRESTNQEKAVEIPLIVQTASMTEEFKDESEDEEIVVYEIKKHWMALFWPLVFSPLCLFYFWNIYIHIDSFIGFLIGLLFLIPIVYPILRYYSDRAVITTSHLHTQQGVVDFTETSIKLDKINLIHMRRSYLGKLCNYGHLIIESEIDEKPTVYKYVQDPEDISFILRNPKAYIEAYLKK